MSGLGRSAASGAGHRGRGHAGMGSVDRWRALQGELQREWSVGDGRADAAARRAAIVARYAQHDAAGHVILCTPSDAERAACAAAGDDPHSAGKVTYPSVDVARAAERELRRVSGGVRQYAYACARSASGHAHLTRRRTSPGRSAS